MLSQRVKPNEAAAHSIKQIPIIICRVSTDIITSSGSIIEFFCEVILGIIKNYFVNFLLYRFKTDKNKGGFSQLPSRC